MSLSLPETAPGRQQAIDLQLSPVPAVHVWNNTTLTIYPHTIYPFTPYRDLH